MRWSERIYDVPLHQPEDGSGLRALAPAELAEADEEGFLAGNALFQDLSGLSWENARATFDLETVYLDRLQRADSLEAAAEAIDEERLEAFDEAADLWDLDIGVASAVVVLSALGAVPAASCNAGGFGGVHPAAHPYVAFYADAAVFRRVAALAVAAGVGLTVGEDGVARLYADRDLGLRRFAKLALEKQA